MTEPAPRLLLVEDDARLGPIVADVLGADWDVTLVTDGEQAVTAAVERYFDVMVVDRRLPGMDGVAVVGEIRRRRISTPILMLTALGSLDDRVSGLDAGANDYLVKPFEFAELGARLRALTRDYAPEGEAIAIGGWTLHPETGTITSPYAGRIGLTERETALVRLLAREPTRTFSRAHILTAVFDKGEQLGTVDTYVHYVRRKTDRDLIATVRGVGYRIGTP
ncbi:MULTISPECIES: response regulator transcription factor [unclassified Curtobacterium]|uniref:response regulator transcription factor n=1 Tax=unclassified Curtobacterium TaxID=257496 RepID=UPI000DA6E98A|nr:MULTISPECIES: response regulator transcription factor [unclassified Curtobacterium]PZE23280.1 DNA-binding response regulator [Curtobacterium sp. MCBD17_028]PZF59086.1 DNA-binding response regulator [Curtobacterium sp. MCBD17_013]WIB63091.1 response regulator transcription factor [Curtobacterium sp. MCBD17_040]